MTAQNGDYLYAKDCWKENKNNSRNQRKYKQNEFLLIFCLFYLLYNCVRKILLFFLFSVHITHSRFRLIVECQQKKKSILLSAYHRSRFWMLVITYQQVTLSRLIYQTDNLCHTIKVKYQYQKLRVILESYTCINLFINSKYKIYSKR